MTGLASRHGLRTVVLPLSLSVMLIIATTLVVLHTDGRYRPGYLAVAGCPAKGRVGIAGGAEIVDMPRRELDRELDAMRDMGATWLRVGVDWSRVEERRGVLDWSTTDRVLEAAQAKGFQVLAVILSTPEWARDARAADSQHALPARPEQFGAFAGKAARRYADRISFWEIWNEPNIIPFAKPRPDVDVYSRVLGSASRHIRAAAGRPVTIVTGGLAPAGDDGVNISPTAFIRRLYDLGGQDAWDAIGSHPYTYPALPEDPSTASWNPFLKLAGMRSTIEAHGDAHKPIWITEMGAPTGGVDGVTPEEQAVTLLQVLTETSRGFGPVFVHSTRDRSRDRDDREGNFGLLEYDFEPKPAFTAVKSAAVCEPRPHS